MMNSWPNLARCFSALALVSLAWPFAPVRASDQPPARPAAVPPLDSAVARWRAMRFGMFIHWGPVSLTAKEIGWSRGQSTPIEEYDNLYRRFNPSQFNAEEWVAIAKAAGMRYIVLTAKHHDGFCLWDTKLTDYNIMNTPFHRDVVRELGEACRRQGIAFGTYYSVCDWHHPDFPLTSPGGKVRREHSDIEAYNRYLLGQIQELITKYGPLLTVWNDVPQEFKGRGLATMQLVRRLQPDILINNRTGDGGDYDTPEQKIGSFNLNRPWESCMTVSAHDHWAWGGASDGVKPLEACLRMLVLGSGGDGNVLLNVGPTPEGVIATEQAARLREIGAWLEKYGQSVLDTRGGPYKPTVDFACTRKDRTIYLHLLKRTKGNYVLPALPAKVVSADVLTGGQVRVTQSGNALGLEIVPADSGEFDVIVKLQVDCPAMDLAPIDIPQKR